MILYRPINLLDAPEDSAAFAPFPVCDVCLELISGDAPGICMWDDRGSTRFAHRDHCGPSLLDEYPFCIAIFETLKATATNAYAKSHPVKPRRRRRTEL